MPKRIPTPPPGDDEPKYYTVVQPYPLNANWELSNDYITCGRWVASCLGSPSPFFAIFYKPSARGQILLEINRDYASPERLLGEHRWSEFLRNPTPEETGRVTQIFYSTYSNGRAAQKDGWKRINVADSWFKSWAPENRVMSYPYPPTQWCPLPPEDKTNKPMCRPLPVSLKPPPTTTNAPPPIIPGSSAWHTNKVAPPTNTPAALRGAWAAKQAANQPKTAKAIPVSSTAPWHNPTAPKSNNVHAVPLDLPALSRSSTGTASSNSSSNSHNPDDVDDVATGIGLISMSPSQEATLYGLDAPPIDPSAYVADWEKAAIAEATENSLWATTTLTSASTNLWGDDDDIEKKKQQATEILCTVHGIICKKGICQEYARLLREKERAERDAARGSNKGGRGFSNTGNNRKSNSNGWKKHTWDDDSSSATGSEAAAGGAFQVHVLHIPARVPETASRPLDPSLTSLSVDPAFWLEFFGNATHPNEFSMQMLKNVAARTGSFPIIRPGGVTQDSSVFDAQAGSPTRTTDDSTGVIYRTTYGPAFYESFRAFPDGTRFTVPLNFGNDSLEIALEQARAAVRYVEGEKIFAFELGNEAGNYKATQRNLSTWGPAAYVAEWKNWTSTINDVLPVALRTRWWAGSDGITPAAVTVALQTEDIIARGIDDPPVIREFSQHMYAYSSCRPASAAMATVPNIQNHTNITAFVGLLKEKVAAAEKVGSELVVGEFNSVSCSGKPNVTDIFGQALWVIDTTLYAATLNVSRVHLHQGATLVSQSDSQINVPGANGTPGFSTYDLWYPVDSPLRGRRRSNPSYVSQLFVAEVVGKSRKARLVQLDAPAGVSPDTFAAYAVYEGGVPVRLAVINWQTVNSTMSEAEVEATTVGLTLGRNKVVNVKRLTGFNDEKDADFVTWGGQAWTNGTASGRLKVEEIRNGVVRVRGSEAVLVRF
ncbi:Glycoside hydrolase family 79 protein [Mycena kentingensis (nom. inval.)]|nr:Glycoside hydrolase family 79 protein [Mycena kentingensis (nom. inval.)]